MYNQSGLTGCVNTLSALTITSIGVLMMADDSLPKTRGAAKAAGEKFFFTGKPCKRGHVEKRYLNGVCVGCHAIHTSAWPVRNPESVKEAERRRREKLLADPTALEARRELARDWHRRFPERQSAATRRRKLAKIERTPAWLTADQHAEMTALYAEAIRLTRETGIIHEVDHIIPLQGENVSGLHVPWNLQILTASENRSKGNKHAV